MTPEERLTQAERLLETAARYINQHSEAITRNAEDIAQLRSTSAETLQMFSELAGIFRQNQAEIRRIWEYLLSQSGNGQSS